MSISHDPVKRAHYEQERKKACEPPATLPKFETQVFDDEVLRSKTQQEIDEFMAAAQQPEVHNITASALLCGVLPFSIRTISLMLNAKHNREDFGAPVMLNCGNGALQTGRRLSIFSNGVVNCVGTYAPSDAFAGMISMCAYLNHTLSKPQWSVDRKNKNKVRAADLFNFKCVRSAADETKETPALPPQIKQTQSQVNVFPQVMNVWNIHATAVFESYTFDLEAIHRNWAGSTYDVESIRHLSMTVNEEITTEEKTSLRPVVTVLVYPESLVICGAKSSEILDAVYRYLMCNLAYFAKKKRKNR